MSEKYIRRRELENHAMNCVGGAVPLWDIHNSVKAYTPAEILERMWVDPKKRLPEEKISEMTRSLVFYPCVYRSKVTGMREVRYYQFGQGHFWHGNEMMDGNIEAWAEPMPLPRRAGK